MDSLIRNIENNPRMQPIWSPELETNLPKVAAYADDVGGLIRNNQDSLKNLFDEYERLSSLSGLELNADKTELLRIKSREQQSPEKSL